MTDLLDRLKSAVADRYTIQQELGRGGMAVVYLADDVKHGRPVAVKVLLPELAATLGGERFLQEIRVTANLQHPHILALYDSGEADGFLYYVMPYVEGESLRDRLKRDKQLPVEDALRITEQVASALDFAHRHDVVHRDIKPENVLLHEGEAMVADFGIALAVKAAGGRLTETGLSIGTPEYMSPEQVAGERKIDARSDVYSLACVLYEMLAGQPPFTGATGQAVLARHVTDTAPPITTVRSSVPPGAVAAINRALEKAPADRFETAKAFAGALWAEGVVSEPEINSIVVLPFENLSPDPEQEYFSDGLTEEVISDLSKVRSLRVISRSSAMTFKGSDKRIPEIAKELNVRYALEGSVRKAGNSLRITAQLIDAEDDTHLWTDKYTGTLEDVFDMQEQVSRSIVEALQLRLTPSEQRQITERPIENAQVFDYYLRARHEVNSFTETGIARALEYLQNGLDIVGENALLYGGIAFAHFQAANIGVRQEEAIALAEEYADKALALSPDSAEAHLTLALVYCSFRGDLRRMSDHIKKSLAAKPDDAHTLYWYVIFHFIVGKLDAAAPLAEKAQRLDPLDPLIRWLPAASDLGKGRFNEAANFPWHQLPSIPHFDYFHAVALACAERLDEARALIVERLDAECDDAFAGMSRLLKHAIDGEQDRVREILALEDAETLRRDAVWSYYVASFAALAGMEDTALDWLEHAIDRGFINYPLLAEHDPFLKALRPHGRFVSLMERTKREWETFEF